MTFLLDVVVEVAIHMRSDTDSLVVSQLLAAVWTFPSTETVGHFERTSGCTDV